MLPQKLVGKNLGQFCKKSCRQNHSKTPNLVTQRLENFSSLNTADESGTPNVRAQKVRFKAFANCFCPDTRCGLPRCRVCCATKNRGL